MDETGMDDGQATRPEATEPHILAARLNHAPPDARNDTLRSLPDDLKMRVFGLLDPGNQADILNTTDPATARRLFEEMEPDDRARMLSRLPSERVETLLDQLSRGELALTRKILGYPEESAGRIMTPEFVLLAPDMTATEALDAVRSGEKRAETVLVMPVADARERLLGTVTLAQIALAPPGTRIADLSYRDVTAVSVTDDQEDVARLMKSADLMIVPVVEETGRVVGIVTFDDAMEILEAEESEDFARSGGAEPVDRPYLSVSILRLVRSRIVWLSLLAVAASLTVNVLNAFEDALESVVTLALFIPLLIGIGGNTGAQSATTIVRALAVGDVTPGDALRIAWREVRTGFVMGIAVAAAAFVLITLIFSQPIAIVVAVTLVCICTLAALIGALMPVLARLFSIDPAVFSAPFVTTFVDASGLLVYFLVARVVLGI